MKYQIVVLFLFLGFALSAQNVQEFKIPLNNNGGKGKLSVDINIGPVTVKGTARKDVLVRYEPLDDADVKMKEDKNGLKKISGGAADIEILEKNGEVIIESTSWNKGIRLNIEVPKSFDVNAESYMHGKVLVESVEGEVTIENFNGSIEAKGISGTVNANTYNGDVVVKLDKIIGDAPMSFHTYNGTIDISLPDNAKVDAKVKTDRGDVYTGFDAQFVTAKAKVDKKEGENWNRTFIDGWLEGKINGGGPELKIKTVNGDIYIRKKDQQ